MTIDLGNGLMSLYADNVLSNTQSLTGSGNTLPVFNNFKIGRLGRFNNNNFSPADAFGGLIDDVQVYNTALSASEIDFLYNNPGIAVPEPGALALTGLALLPLSRRRRASAQA